MATMTRFVPLRSALGDMAVLQNRLNSIFQEFAQPETGTEALATGHFVPAVDIYEDQNKLVLCTDVYLAADGGYGAGKGGLGARCAHDYAAEEG